jgi:hypothetical protein
MRSHHKPRSSANGRIVPAPARSVDQLINHVTRFGFLPGSQIR